MKKSPALDYIIKTLSVIGTAIITGYMISGIVIATAFLVGLTIGLESEGKASPLTIGTCIVIALAIEARVIFLFGKKRKLWKRIPRLTYIGLTLGLIFSIMIIISTFH